MEKSNSSVSLGNSQYVIKQAISKCQTNLETILEVTGNEEFQNFKRSGVTFFS